MKKVKEFWQKVIEFDTTTGFGVMKMKWCLAILFLMLSGCATNPCRYIEDLKCHGFGDCGKERPQCELFKVSIHDGTNCSGWCEQ